MRFSFSLSHTLVTYKPLSCPPICPKRRGFCSSVWMLGLLWVIQCFVSRGHPLIPFLNFYKPVQPSFQPFQILQFLHLRFLEGLDFLSQSGCAYKPFKLLFTDAVPLLDKSFIAAIVNYKEIVTGIFVVFRYAPITFIDRLFADVA